LFCTLPDKVKDCSFCEKQVKGKLKIEWMIRKMCKNIKKLAGRLGVAQNNLLVIVDLTKK
jgi:hypothetical protein